MKKLNRFLLLFSLLMFVIPVWAKRLAPATIPPIKYKKGIITQSFERNEHSFSVHVISKHKSGEIRWQTKLYSVKYQKNLETDVQDVHLKSLTIEAGEVTAIDERGKSYKLDISDGSLIKKN